jgi:excisionase family DNA binding protein
MSIIKTLRERTDPLNVGDLAKLLNVTEATVQRWVRNRQIPFIRIGDVIRFDGCTLADRIELEGVCNQPIVGRFYHPRAPGNPADYQMLQSDLGELASKEIVPAPGIVQQGEDTKIEAQ